MTFTSAVIACSAFLFAVCAVTFTIRSIKSYNFRKNVALPHGFSEGIMTGASYPALIAVLSLLFIQFASFIAFKSPSETICAFRVAAYLITTAVFFILLAKTPALLAYWFGQNGLWEHSGRKGKIAYSDIYNAQLSKKLRLPIMNNQQLCKFTFYVKGKNIFFHPKKYVCKMTACEISALSRQVEFTENAVKTAGKRVHAARSVLPTVLFIICILSIVQFCSSGILNEAKYTVFDSSAGKEIVTLASHSEIAVSADKLFVYYDSLNAANVYSTDGIFQYSVSMTPAGIKSSDFAVADGCIYYRIGNSLLVYSQDGVLSETKDILPEHSAIFEADNGASSDGGEYLSTIQGVIHRSRDGKETVIIQKPLINLVFSSDLMWLVNALFIFVAMILRSLADEYKRPYVEQNISAYSAESSDDDEGDTPDVTEIADETVAS